MKQIVLERMKITRSFFSLLSKTIQQLGIIWFGYRNYARPRSSGRIINYGVVSGSGGYRPAQYSPGPGIVGWALTDCKIMCVTDFSRKAIVKYLPLWGEALNEKNQINKLLLAPF